MGVEIRHAAFVLRPQGGIPLPQRARFIARAACVI